MRNSPSKRRSFIASLMWSLYCCCISLASLGGRKLYCCQTTAWAAILSSPQKVETSSNIQMQADKCVLNGTALYSPALSCQLGALGSILAAMYTQLMIETWIACVPFSTTPSSALWAAIASTRQSSACFRPSWCFRKPASVAVVQQLHFFMSSRMLHRWPG